MRHKSINLRLPISAENVAVSTAFHKFDFAHTQKRTGSPGSTFAIIVVNTVHFPPRILYVGH